jgi:riboflavin kinase/FMN adenylyltransferase
MEITWGLENLKENAARSVVTIGVFDGVHLGHQAIMRTLGETARRHKARSVAITFDRLPEEALNREGPPPYITAIRQKMDLIARQGLDSALVLHADRKLLSMCADDFVREVLVEKLHVAEVVVGHSFVFGKGRAGNVDLLSEMGSALRFAVTVVPPVLIDNAIVSSTAIRRLISAGEVTEAAMFLGHPFVLDGRVVAGKGIGRQLGFPTANVEPLERQVVPASGVYVVEVAVKETRALGVANIGTRPTFGEGATSIEVYIIGFSDDIYGEEIEVTFQKRLRDEIRFPDTESLVRQIHQDVAQARMLLLGG